MAKTRQVRDAPTAAPAWIVTLFNAQQFGTEWITLASLANASAINGATKMNSNTEPMTDKTQTLRDVAQQMLNACERIDEQYGAVQFGVDFSALGRSIQAALAQQPAEGATVHQFRRRGCADWYDGLPDHSDGGGPYETRVLHTTPPAQAQRAPDWSECLRISELPEVDEALRNFAEGETSEDQAVCIVQAVLRAAIASQGGEG